MKKGTQRVNDGLRFTYIGALDTSLHKTFNNVIQ